jgi:hypothetical protein
MPAFQFNSQGIDPQYGGGSPQLPLGKHPVVIVGSALKPTAKGNGGYLELTLEAIDGPAKGGQQIDRLNLQNINADTVRIANQQLAAYCAVTGVFAFNATEELHGKPFVVDIGQDKERATQHRVQGLFDMAGNPPGQAGAGAAPGGQQQPPQQPPAQQFGQQQPPADQGQQGNGAPAGWGQQGQGQQQQQGGGWNQGGTGAAPASTPGWGQR